MKEKDQEAYNHWEDEEFVAEMERRIEEIESGKVQAITLEEFKAKLELQKKQPPCA